MQPESLALTLPIRQLVEFLLRTGSIDSRFTGFDRANEGARLHRKLQKYAVKDFPDYAAEVSLTQEYGCCDIEYTLEGRADGILPVQTVSRQWTKSKPPPCLPIKSPENNRPNIGHKPKFMLPSMPDSTSFL